MYERGTINSIRRVHMAANKPSGIAGRIAEPTLRNMSLHGVPFRKISMVARSSKSAAFSQHSRQLPRTAAAVASTLCK
jgi:hypothetical protein